MAEFGMFDAIKYICCAVVVVAYFLILRKFPGFTRKKRLLLFLPFLALAFAIHFFPGKYLPVRYSSAVELISAQYGGSVEIIAEGENSCGILYSVKRDEQTVFCVKDDKGYCLPDGIDRRTIWRGFVGDWIVWVDKIPGTEDYYVEIYGMADSESIPVSDNRGSEFKLSSTVFGEEGSTWIMSALAYIGNDIDNYCLTVGEESLQFSG